MTHWVVFAASALAVVTAGRWLARSGDEIADRTGLGRAWVGAILVAGATSLPELLTDLFAVLQNTPALAVGDLFGSSMANMLILAVADLAHHRVRVLARIAINQLLVAVLAISLTVVAAAGIVTGDLLTVGTISWATVLIGVGYVVGMRIIYANRPGPPFQTVGEAEIAEQRAARLAPSVAIFTGAALVILVAARYLASSAVDVADSLGISTGFMGLALLALTTSLPEISVTVASIRAGSYDLAVGNLFGSNAFNMLIFVPLELVDDGGSLLASAGQGELLGALVATLLMGLTAIDVLDKMEHRPVYADPSVLFRVLIYGGGLYLMYQLGS